MMTITRLSSGITSLDAALQGGYPKGSVISLYGSTSHQRKRVALSFLANGKENGQGGIYITTRDSIATISQHIQQQEMDLSSVTYLDAVHWKIKRVNPKLNTSASYEVNNLTDLNALLAKIMEACNGNQINRILFDSPTSILLYTTPGKEQVYKFFELLTAYTRSHNITLCYTLEEGVHGSDIVSTMHFLSDGVISIRSQNGKSEYCMQIQRMTLTKFHQGPISLQ